jgi:hypothetical protein
VVRNGKHDVVTARFQGATETNVRIQIAERPE